MPSRNAKRPLISVISLTFNHEQYVAQALDSFLMQEGDFDLEILIHDDASTDKTAAIIRRYAKKYPDIIKPVLQTVNQYSRGNDSFVKDLFVRSKGQFIAQCEGDDYWTDPHKLQKQLTAMQRHADWGLCFHPVRVVFENGKSEAYTFPEYTSSAAFTTKELLNQNYIQSNSVLFRRADYAALPTGIMPLDWYLNLYHAQYGKVGFLEETMSVYRRHDGGMWWKARNKRAEFWEKYALLHLKTYEEILKIYGDKPQYGKVIQGSLARIFDALVDNGLHDLLRKSLQEYPVLAEKYVLYQRRIIDGERSVKEQQQAMLEELHHAVELKDNHIDNLEHELATIQSSRLWKSVSRFTKAERAKRKG